MAYTVKIDTRHCLSSGNCISDAPSAFTWDADELATLRPDAATLADSTLRLLATNCPGQAIRLYDEHGDEIEL